MARETLSGFFDSTPLLMSRSVAQNDRVLSSIADWKIMLSEDVSRTVS
jgi:hypothetical protein